MVLVMIYINMEYLHDWSYGVCLEGDDGMGLRDNMSGIGTSYPQQSLLIHGIHMRGDFLT